MTCQRCQGCMVSDRFIDLEETGHLWMTGWRCMNCGYVVDHVTEQNRRLQAQGLIGLVEVKRKPEGAASLPEVASAQLRYPSSS
jgi:hypothetical protein